MRLMKSFLLSLVLLFSITTVVCGWSEWRTLKTEHFTVFYHPEREGEAIQLLEVLEYYRPMVEELSGNEDKHVPVVIDDVGTMVNGFSNPIGNMIHVFNYPPSGGFGENWWSIVGVHEYTHHLSLTNRGGAVALWQKVFGTSLFTVPNLLTPGWIFEGITVYTESQLSPYQGRLNEGLFDAYIGACVAEGRFPDILDATYGPTEFQMSGIYTYGGEFFEYLAKQYGTDKFGAFFKANGSTFGYLLPVPAVGIDRSAKKVYGKSFPELWQEWKEYECKRFAGFRMEGEKLTNHGWYVQSPVTDGEQLYFQRLYPVKTGAFDGNIFSEILERDLSTAKEKTIISSTSAMVLPSRLKDGFLYYGLLDVKYGYDNATDLSLGHFVKLHRFDRKSGKDQIILSDEIRAYDVDPTGKILFSRDRDTAFGSELYLYDPASKERKLLFSTDYLVDEIICGGNRMIVSARKDWMNFDIYEMNPVTGEFSVLIQSPHVETGLSFSGEKLFFHSDYDQTVSAYCYDFADGKLYRLTENGVAMNPLFDPRTNSLYYVGLHVDGFDLYQKSAEFKEFQFPAPETTLVPAPALPEVAITRGNYWDNLKTLTPKSWSPVIILVPSGVVPGVTFSGGDAVMDFPFYQMTFLYDYQTQNFYTQIDAAINYFAPLQTMVSYNNLVDGGVLGLNLSYPLLTKTSPGLSQVTLGSMLSASGLATDVTPYLGIGFQFPKTNGAVSVNVPVYPGRDLQPGIAVSLAVEQYLPHSDLSLKLRYTDNPGSLDPVFPDLRGYGSGLDGTKGQMVSLDYSLPLLKIRSGLWNPNLYFEDLTINFFGDWARTEKGEQYAGGVELHLETKTYYLLPLDLGIRFSMNKEGEGKIGVFCEPGITL